jgi:hypothetical protein
VKLKFQNLFASLLDKVTLGVAKALGVFVDQEKLLKYKPIPLCDFYRDLNRPVPKYFIGHAVYTIDQKAYRFRNDDGTQTSATWKAAENTRWEVTDFTTADINFRLRMMVQETGGSSGSTDATIQYQRNNGTWTDITTTSSYVRIRLSSNFADGAATTSQLTSGTGSFIAGQMRETVTAATINHAGSDYGENEWSLFFRSADCVNGDNYKFRMLRSGTAFSTNSQYPEVFSWTPISTIEDLNNIRNSTSGSTIVGNFRLTKDLDFNDDASYANPANKTLFTTGSGFIALGQSGNPWFGASIDGDGHTISNLMCNDTTTGVSNSGLIGVMDAINSSSTITIENLGLINPRINANATNSAFNQCGALIMGIDPAGTNIVRRCFVRGGIVVGGSATGNNGTGGMIGISHEYSTGTVTIQDCYVEDTEVYRNGTAPAATNGVGGLIGTTNLLTNSSGKAVNIIDCWASARIVDGDSTAQRGGLRGYNNTSGAVTTSYYDSTKTNYAGAGGTAQTTTQLKTHGTYSANFSIANGFSNLTTETWYIQTSSFPRLRYENYSPTVTRTMLSGSPITATYHFDASDVAVTDPNSYWGAEANAFDGTLATYATNNGASGDGSVSTGYIEATGTTAPASGGHLVKVRTRIHTVHSITDNETARLNVYSGTELIGHVQRGPIGGTAWSDYVDLKTPSSGWTWAKLQALRARFWSIRMINSGYVAVDKIEIEVTSETIPTTTDSTPALISTGTDTEGNDVRYQVAVSDSSAMDPYLDNANYIVTNVGGIVGDTNAPRRAQSFTTKSGNDLSSIMVRVGRTGTPVDNVQLKIYSDLSNNPNTVLATSSNNYVGSTLSQNDIDTGNFTTLVFNFSGLSLSNATRYWFSVERTGSTSATNYYNVEGSSTISYGSESGRFYDGTSWVTTSVASVLFNDYLIVSQTANTYTSGTDSGFSGTPDNTDPYASAQNVTHTIQTPLASGTYYWRARGIDPTGRNIYGAWSDSSSLTVSAVSSFTKTHTTDSLKKKPTLATHSTSSNRKKALTNTHTTSASKQTAGNYHYEGKSILPGNADLLAESYTATDYSDVSSDNAVYKDFSSSGFIIEQFWKYNTNSTDDINMTVNMKSSLAPTVSTVYLQIYNYNTSTWTTIATNAAAAVDTDFTLTGSQTVTPANYYTTNNKVAVRIYQEAV